MPKLDVTEERFFHQKIKVPRVVCEHQVQAIGRTQIEAPANLAYVDGKFQVQGREVTVKLVPSKRQPQLLTATVIPGKVLNTGVVFANLVIQTLDGETLCKQKNIPIYWHDVVKCPGALPGDRVQKHDFQLEGFEDVAPSVGGGPLMLFLTVAVEYCLIVASEKVLKVDSAETFC